MNKNKVNEFYVINQPKHVNICIVDLGGVNLKTPLSTLQHELLDKLHDGQDIVFLFPKDATKYINPEKFATLYQACMYVVAGDNISYTFLRTLNYIREIFISGPEHIQFFYLALNTFEDLDALEKLGSINMSSLDSCVLRIERYSSEEFYGVYSKKSGWWKKEDKQGIHRIYNTPDSLIRLSLSSVNILREIDKKYYDTFKTNLQDFIPSAIKYYGIKYIEKTL